MTLGINERIDDRQRREGYSREIDTNQRACDGSHQAVVRPGDSLWSIAAREYRDGSLWPVLAQRNPEAADEQGNLFLHSGASLDIPTIDEALLAVADPPGYPGVDGTSQLLDGEQQLAEVTDPASDPFQFIPWSQSPGSIDGRVSSDSEVLPDSNASIASGAELEASFQQLLGALGGRNGVPSRNQAFGSGEHALNNFTQAIPNFSDFTSVAESYGLETSELLAIFMQEGGLKDHPYRLPAALSGASNTTLASWHLWSAHGMDDFAVVNRKQAGKPDNTFSPNRNHGQRIQEQLSELRQLNLLWNEDGVRPSNPEDQLTVDQIMDHLEASIGPNGMPTPRFRELAYRIVAASVSRRTLPVQRNRTELERLGFEQTEIDQFRHFNFNRALHNMEAAPSSPEAQQAFNRILENAHDNRMPVAVARLSMGTHRGYLNALGQVSRDLTEWNSEANLESRDATARWALAQNAALMTRNETNENRLLENLANSISADTLPNRRLRQSIEEAIQNLRFDRDFDGIQQIMDFIIDGSNRYSQMETVQDWIVAQAGSRPDRRGIPDDLYSRLIPSTNFARQINRSITRYGALESFATELVRQREAREVRAEEP